MRSAGKKLAEVACAFAVEPSRPPPGNDIEQWFHRTDDLTVYLWPCNVAAWGWWCAVQSQWRTGMGGPTGLDYSALLAYLREVQCLDGEALRDAFGLLQAAEHSVLRTLAQRAD